jgi:hypothetical protein
MVGESRRWLLGAAVTFSALMGFVQPGTAADIAVAPPAAAFPAQAVAPSGWSYRFTPYVWLPSTNGTSTVRGVATDIDASFIDVVEHAQIPKDLFAVMGYFEARNDRVSLFTDVVYQRLATGGSGSRSRNLGRLGIDVDASIDITFEMATVEAGAAYEVARWSAGPGSFTALDVMAGGRFWWQKATASLELTGTINLRDLTVEGNRAFARSGDINWFDPFIGGRIRHQFAPGKELVLSGDVGGFGVGSDFSWQLVGAYSWDFATTGTTTWAAIIGYRALFVDYKKGSGFNEYGYDILQHGPIIGVSLRF